MTTTTVAPTNFSEDGYHYRVRTKVPPVGNRRGYPARSVSSLNEDWSRIITLATTERALRRWQETAPVLATLRLEEIRKQYPTGPEANAVFEALVLLHQSGDSLAGRAALQMVLSKLINQSRRLRKWSEADVDNCPENRMQRMLAAFWTVICRPGRKITITNTCLDALHEVTGRSLTVARGGRRTMELPTTDAELESRIESAASHQRTSIYPLSTVEPSLAISCGEVPDATTATLLDLLEWAVAARVIGSSMAQLLDHYYGLAPTGLGERQTHREELAAELGISPEALRQRVSRAVRSLARAVHDDVAADSASALAS